MGSRAGVDKHINRLRACLPGVSTYKNISKYDHGQPVIRTSRQFPKMRHRPYNFFLPPSRLQPLNRKRFIHPLSHVTRHVRPCLTVRPFVPVPVCSPATPVHRIHPDSTTPPPPANGPLLGLPNKLHRSFPCAHRSFPMTPSQGISPPKDLPPPTPTWIACSKCGPISLLVCIHLERPRRSPLCSPKNGTTESL